MLKFSVIIPTCNRPDFLLAAVNSVRSQSQGDLELIVVNDGDTPIILPPDPRILVIENNQQGAVVARNAAVSLARGKYIAFLDDDDQWTDKNFLTKAEFALETSADFCFADGDIRFFDNRPTLTFAQDADVNTLATDNTILISTVCYHRSLHQKLGLFDEALPYYWDWDWYLRVARAGFKLVRIRENAAAITIHEHNMSGDSRISEREENLELLSKKHGLDGLTLKNHLTFAH